MPESYVQSIDRIFATADIPQQNQPHPQVYHWQKDRDHYLLDTREEGNQRNWFLSLNTQGWANLWVFLPSGEGGGGDLMPIWGFMRRFTEISNVSLDCVGLSGETGPDFSYVLSNAGVELNRETKYAECFGLLENLMDANPIKFSMDTPKNAFYALVSPSNRGESYIDIAVYSGGKTIAIPGNVNYEHGPLHFNYKSPDIFPPLNDRDKEVTQGERVVPVRREVFTRLAQLAQEGYRIDGGMIPIQGKIQRILRDHVGSLKRRE